MNHSDSLASLATAKAKAQAAFLPVGKDQSAEVFSKRTGATFKYSYADLASCLAAVIPALSANGLAIFQPIRFLELPDGGPASVEVTTLLVHGESGEWISEDFQCPVADSSDARSIGSAATYGRRYSLQAMLGFASEEDDDAEAARGGAHEQKRPQTGGAMTCPKCGKVGTIQKNRDGSWSCWSSKGGCEAKFDLEPGPIEHAKPVQTDMMPQKTQPSAEVRSAPQAPEAKPNATPPAPPTRSPQPKPKGPSRGASKAAPSAVAAAPKAEGAAAENLPSTSDDTPPPVADEVEPPFSQVTFEIQGKTYVTNGISQTQLLATFDLCSQLDRLHGKEYTKGILQKLFRVSSRTQLTEPQAKKFLEVLQKDLEKKP